MIPDNVQAQFNQASYQQVRLNERISINQRLWSFPLVFNDVYQCYNYEVIFNSQCQILSEICPKLKDIEFKSIDEKRKEIEDLQSKGNLWDIVSVSKGYMSGTRKSKRINFKNWSILKTKLFEFGNELMRLMDSKGLGNPNKADPTAAIIEM